MSTDGPETVALAFVEQINRRDPSGLSRLMTKDHVFVDSWGQSTRGREAMHDGWVGYYRMFPDYQVGTEDVMSEGDVVLLTGTARGTYSVDGELRKENEWNIPAAWKAVVRGGLVAYWQVFADNGPVYKIIERADAAKQ